MANVLAFAESRAGALRKVALEAVTAARALADTAGGGEVHAIVAGAPGIAGEAPRLGAHGADRVVAVEHAAFANYDPESIAATVAERAKSGGYRAIIFSASAQGRDLAPRVAAKLGVGMLSDVISLEVSGDAIVAKHPAYANKVIATVAVTGSPAIVSLRPNAFTPVENARAGTVESAQPAADPGASRVVVRETIKGSSTRPDLTEAPVIVSGGRGLKAPENFKLVEELAEAFGNAAVGCTRAVTDDGWRPHSDQIGQTGRVVSPQLYVAVGISGAIQHLAGMRTSGTIVAINKDREAPIFKVADYGIVGDALQIVPALTKAVREARRHG
ncbi:MAG TPA: electron transfer flavoprotein subunit alpha/FixB family protein [Gemmatimonadaceae bacterium]|nr:electron transfer flavoprotein subunit alpha/FixB family protein [Gemmatimonadaceae bacterium]